jgi:hypothetical protein
MADFCHKSGVTVGAAAAEAIIGSITATLASEAEAANGSTVGAAAESAPEPA